MITLTLLLTAWLVSTTTYLATYALFGLINIHSKQLLSIHPTCCPCGYPEGHMAELNEIETYLNGVQ